ncbi:SDR family oxidoreductase [Amnibacterium flavum]|uniref:NAD-dependent dehydratase n=1 Tax=Amnibacterium flavum TaxID=2173173 RepID=A0A2V1HSK6_9MICO|nr:SDR family oxidoreductase [Amnibacterium flavum]PVZ93940.1 NAD-dependent dehydratase [Amnibacterium flavum]
MTRIAVIGAHGLVGQNIINLAYSRGADVTGVIRNADHGEDIVRLGGEVTLVDIESASAEELAEHLRGADAVVFSAGAGPNSGVARKRTVDFGGAVLTADAAKIAGVNRVVQVSAMGVDEPLPADTDEVWAAYVEAKRDADLYLKASGLDWTIIRPGGLTNDEGTGKVRLADKVERGSIPRADVAAIVLAAIDDDRTIGRTWEAISGPDTIEDAIDAALAAIA